MTPAVTAELWHGPPKLLAFYIVTAAGKLECNELDRSHFSTMDEAMATREDDVEAPPNTRHRGDEPNVTIVFCRGEGKDPIKIRYNSDFLRRFSGFFDRLLPIKERHGQPLVFEFTSGQCPVQFKHFVSLCQPFATEKVTHENLETTINWANYLECDECLRVCDQLLLDQVNTSFMPLPPAKYLSQARRAGAAAVAVETLQLCLQSSLTQSESRCMELLEETLRVYPSAVTLDIFKQMLACLENSKAVKECLWKPLTDLLPVSLYTAEQKRIMHDEYESDRLNEIFLLAFLHSIDKKKNAVASRKSANAVKQANAVNKTWEMASKRTLEQIAAALHGQNKPEFSIDNLVQFMASSNYWDKLIPVEWRQETFFPRVLVNTSDEEGSSEEEEEGADNEED